MADRRGLDFDEGEGVSNRDYRVPASKLEWSSIDKDKHSYLYIIFLIKDFDKLESDKIFSSGPSFHILQNKMRMRSFLLMEYINTACIIVALLCIINVETNCFMAQCTESAIIPAGGTPKITAQTDVSSHVTYTEAGVTVTSDSTTNTFVIRWYQRYVGITQGKNGVISCELYDQATVEIYMLHLEQNERDCQQKCSDCLCGEIKKNGISNVIKADTIRKAKDWGWGFLKRCVFPLVSEYWREVWIYVQFLIALVMLLYQVISFALDEEQRTPFDIAAFAFTVISSALSLIDLLVNIYTQRCRICRDCVSNTRCCRAQAQGDECQQHEDSPADCNWTNQCCKLCFTNDYSDLVRTLLSELFIYPIVILSMFRFIIGLKTDVRYRTVRFILSVVFFALPIIWNIVTVYVLRLVALAFIMKTVQEVKKAVHVPGTEETEETNTGIMFHIRFFFHVLGQMVSQALMIACVGYMFYETNYEAKDASSFKVIGYLWYLIIGAFLIPLLGVFTFALTNYYEIEEYPIAHFIAIFGYLKKQKGFVHMNAEVREEMVEKVSEILDAGFAEIHSRNCCEKSMYSFLSPGIMLLCLLYGTMVNVFLFFSVGVFFAVPVLFVAAMALIYLANIRIIIATFYVSMVLIVFVMGFLIFLHMSPLIICVYLLCKSDNCN